MVAVCPTVTASTVEEYKFQLERVSRFAPRLHLDLSDGVFSPTKLVDANDLWWADDKIIDIHVMLKKPELILDHLISLKPSLVILHAESQGNFYDMAKKLQDNDIKVGLALLQPTEVRDIAQVFDVLDHILIFGGKLGSFGGQVDPKLFRKVAEVRKLKHDIEIGWDGGINDDNARDLIEIGVHVLNVGGYIQRSSEPQSAYDTLVTIAENAGAAPNLK